MLWDLKFDFRKSQGKHICSYLVHLPVILKYSCKRGMRLYMIKAFGLGDPLVCFVRIFQHSIKMLTVSTLPSQCERGAVSHIHRDQNSNAFNLFPPHCIILHGLILWQLIQGTIKLNRHILCGASRKQFYLYLFPIAPVYHRNETDRFPAVRENSVI